MFCRKCGRQNDDTAYRCNGCGEVLQEAGPPGLPVRDIPTYLAQAILVTLLCCMPFGVVAIVFAAQVNGKLDVGDYAGAVNASKTAKMWCWIAFGVGLVPSLLWVAFVMLGAFAGAMG